VEPLLVYIVLLWMGTAVTAAALFAFSVLTRPSAKGPELQDAEGRKLHFWASVQEMEEAGSHFEQPIHEEERRKPPKPDRPLDAAQGQRNLCPLRGLLSVPSDTAASKGAFFCPR